MKFTIKIPPPDNRVWRVSAGSNEVTIGMLMTPEEAAAFDASSDPEKPLPSTRIAGTGERVCPECGEYGSWVRGKGYSSTLVGYYSPPGHDHDDNCKKYPYMCKNGHEFTVIPQNTCPACDWVGKNYCWTCGK